MPDDDSPEAAGPTDRIEMPAARVPDDDPTQEEYQAEVARVILLVNTRFEFPPRFQVDVANCYLRESLPWDAAAELLRVYAPLQAE